MAKPDGAIENEKKSLVGVAEESFYKVLDVTDETLNYYQTIMIDFNSLISLFSYRFVLDDIESKEFDIPEMILTLTDIFKSVFLGKYMYRNVIFFYKTYDDNEPILREIHPNWRVNHDKNPNALVFKTIRDHFIGLINRMASVAKNITVITTERKEHTYLPLELIYKGSIPAFQKVLVISRDPMCMLNCTNLNVSYYDGAYLYAYDRILRQTGAKIKFESIHPTKLPLIFILAGISKLGYKGMAGKGITTSIKYCVTHNINTVDDLLACEELKSIHKYVPIFFFDRYIKYLESIEGGVK